jgi:hypothetical protein
MPLASPWPVDGLFYQLPAFDRLQDRSRLCGLYRGFPVSEAWAARVLPSSGSRSGVLSEVVRAFRRGVGDGGGRVSDHGRGGFDPGVDDERLIFGGGGLDPRPESRKKRADSFPGLNGPGGFKNGV